MWTRQHQRRRTGALIVPTISAAVIAYFGYHAYQGDYGIYSMYKLQERVAVLELELADKARERGRLERRVVRLQDGNLERDMVDELTRRALHVSLPDEITIMRPPRQ